MKQGTPKDKDGGIVPHDSRFVTLVSFDENAIISS